VHHHEGHAGPESLEAPPASGDEAVLELEITNYFMGSACPDVEQHVTEVPGVQGVALDRTNGIIQVSYVPDQVSPDTIIEAVKHCGFMCQEGGPVHEASRPGPPHAEHAGHGDHIAASMRNLFIMAAVLTIVELAYSPLATRLLGLSPPTPFGIPNDIFQFLLTTPVVFWGGRQFL